MNKECWSAGNFHPKKDSNCWLKDYILKELSQRYGCEPEKNKLCSSICGKISEEWLHSKIDRNKRNWKQILETSLNLSGPLKKMQVINHRNSNNRV